MSRAALAAAGVVALGAVPRVLLAAGALPGWLRPFTWSDAYFTWQRGLSGGRVPYRDTYFEYPPLLGYLSGALSLVTGSAVAYVVAWAILQVACAALVAVLLTREAGADRTLRRWSLAPQLALLGTLNFDLLAVAACVLAVVWARRARPLRASVALAVGTALKIFPLVAIPLLVVRDARRPAVAAGTAAVFALVVALAYAPSLSAPYSSAESVTRYAAGIEANPDSIWRLGHSLVAGLGVPAAPAVIVAVTALGLVLTYLVVVLPRAARAADPALGIGLAVLVLLLWSRLYSPQFSLWWLPFATLLPIGAGTFAALVAADIAVFLTISPLGLVEWPAGDPTEGTLTALLAAAVVARHLALIRAAVDVVAAARAPAG